MPIPRVSALCRIRRTDAGDVSHDTDVLRVLATGGVRFDARVADVASDGTRCIRATPRSKCAGTAIPCLSIRTVSFILESMWTAIAISNPRRFPAPVAVAVSQVLQD